MNDPYKVKRITEELDKTKRDAFYLVRLRGDTGNAINMDTKALELLRAYYDGQITDEEVDMICRR